jgi:hypothetical protein
MIFKMSKYILFEKYLENTLSDQERSDFELRLQNEAGFKADFDGHLKTQKVFDLLLEEELVGEIEEIKKGKNSTKLRILRPMLMAAASLLVLISAYFLLDSNSPNQKLMEEFFIPTSLGATRNGDTDKDLLDIQKQYRMAEAAYIEKDYHSAIAELSMLINMDNPLIKEPSQWLLVLSYLGIENNNEATFLLEKIAKDSNHDYSARAKELLVRLKN